MNIIHLTFKEFSDFYYEHAFQPEYKSNKEELHKTWYQEYLENPIKYHHENFENLIIYEDWLLKRKLIILQKTIEAIEGIEN